MRIFLNYECSTIAEIVFKEYDLKPQLNSIDQEFIFKNIENKEELDQNILEEILIQDAQFLSEDMDKIIEDSIKTLNFSKLKLELDNVTKKIQEFDGGENMEEFKALSIRQMELKKSIRILYLNSWKGGSGIGTKKIKMVKIWKRNK